MSGIGGFTTDELAMLVGDGFDAGYMGDIAVGDLVAVAPVCRWRDDDRVLTLRVTRLTTDEQTWIDEYGDRQHNRLMRFIGIDLDDLPRHCAYGSTYPCMFKRGAFAITLPELTP